MDAAGSRLARLGVLALGPSVARRSAPPSWARVIRDLIRATGWDLEYTRSRTLIDLAPLFEPAPDEEAPEVNMGPQSLEELQAMAAMQGRTVVRL